MCKTPSHNNILKLVKEVDGERHHLKKKVIEMEVVPNSCANKKSTHKNMKEEHYMPLEWHPIE
jgi:hypothetical protein